jgi:hypothetical protein
LKVLCRQSALTLIKADASRRTIFRVEPMRSLLQSIGGGPQPGFQKTRA